ncbi:MAG: DUF5615 family PIN-like protein [Verrucomicrobiota bacterium]
MPVALYLDVHVPMAITAQLRRRCVNVLHAIEEGTEQLSDADLLQVATQASRVLFTQDIRFKALAERWQAAGKPFTGLVFGHQLRGTIGDYVRDLELIAQATDLREWQSMVIQIPL